MQLLFGSFGHTTVTVAVAIIILVWCSLYIHLFIDFCRADDAAPPFLQNLQTYQFEYTMRCDRGGHVDAATAATQQQQQKRKIK